MGGKDISLTSHDLFHLCRSGNVEKVAAWIQTKTKKSKLNFLRSNTPNAGWLAAIRDPVTAYTSLHWAARNGHISVVKLLIDHDDQLVTSKDQRGCLPIHLAAWNGHDVVVKCLLEANPSTVDAVNNAKESSLHLSSQYGHGKVVLTLLQNRANVQLRNARYETALDIAARCGKENVCRLLVCHCPELALQSAAQCSRSDNKTISQHVVYPLHVAARNGHTECLKVLCESGFNINYVTEEGTALHVAALYGKADAVRILLHYGIDPAVKDSHGKTALEKVEEHENQKATDLTQIMQSREGWAECRKAIENFDPAATRSQKSMNDDPNIIWRSLPENSIALNGKHESATSYGDIYHPPSMVVEHIISEENGSELNNSTLDPSIDSVSNHSSLSPSVASTSSGNRSIPKFPVTSPNSKTRHTAARRSGHAPPGQVTTAPAPAPDSSSAHSSNCDSGCSYQPPPNYQTWQSKYDGPMYNNIPQPYDNRPLGGHHKWTHECANHGTHKTGTTSQATGRAIAARSNERSDGTRTIPAAISPDLQSLNSKAPLAMPEELGNSTCTSLISMSPERVLNPIDDRLRRSVTTTSEDRTLISMHEDLLQGHDCSPVPPATVTTPVKHTPDVVITLPESLSSGEMPVDSSCSSPHVSRFSSSSQSPSQGSVNSGIARLQDTKESTNVVVSMRQPKRSAASAANSGRSPSAIANDMDQAEGWRKIEEILSALRRDSFFAEPTTNSQVAVSVRNRKSRALTLQLNPNGDQMQPSAQESQTPGVFTYPSAHEDLAALSRPYAANGKSAKSVASWLNVQIGLPLSRSSEIAAILERNGFDVVPFMKGSLSREAMVEMGIDKSIQHQVMRYLDSQKKSEIPFVGNFEYASDWLSALCLIDYLGAFAKHNLTATVSIIAARIQVSDLRRMGVDLIGHIERLMQSIYAVSDRSNRSSLNLPPTPQTVSAQSSPTALKEAANARVNSLKWEEKTALLLHQCSSYSAHYLGSAEISNVEGAEDCRRAMISLKGRIKQLSKIPQVVLQISVNGVNVLDSSNNRLAVQHEINRIQVVCQDELDLNCFAYIYQDGDKNFCHVYCVLTAELARDIIMTLGHAFNLAYNMALGHTGNL